MLILLIVMIMFCATDIIFLGFPVVEPFVLIAIVWLEVLNVGREQLDFIALL